MEHSYISAMENTEKKSIRPVGTISFAGFILAAIATIIAFNSESIPAWLPGIITAILLVSVTGIIASVVASVPVKDREGVQWQAMLQAAAVACVVAVFGGFAYALLEALLDLPRLSAGVFGMAVGVVWLVAGVVIRAEGRG